MLTIVRKSLSEIALHVAPKITLCNMAFCHVCNYIFQAKAMVRFSYIGINRRCSHGSLLVFNQEGNLLKKTFILGVAKKVPSIEIRSFVVNLRSYTFGNIFV